MTYWSYFNNAVIFDATKLDTGQRMLKDLRMTSALEHEEFEMIPVHLHINIIEVLKNMYVSSFEEWSELETKIWNLPV